MRAPLRTPFVHVIIYEFAGDYNMPVFWVHVSHFVSLDYLIYSIWKRKRKELITSSRDVSQFWCSGPLMNSCSLYNFQLRFFTGYLTGCWKKHSHIVLQSDTNNLHFHFTSSIGRCFYSKQVAVRRSTLGTDSGNVSFNFFNFVLITHVN